MRALLPSLQSFTIGAAIALSGANASAEPIYAVTDGAGPRLVSFDSATPGTLTTNVAISGLAFRQTLRAIDFRPSNGQLYALSNQGAGTAAQLYTVNLLTGALATVGSGLTLTGNRSDHISIDFNPFSDVLRVVTGGTQSYRVNAATGTLIAQDTNFNPASVYANIAYSNNVVGAGSTTLYAYDFNAANDRVGTIPNPNTGSYFNIGNTGVEADTAAVGFDISGRTGIAYSSLDDFSSPDTNAEFYTVNLATGAFSFVGNFNVPILDIAVRPTPEPATLALAGFALAAVAMTRGRRRQAN